ncbi:OLC1v1017360C1 [Oldenlandia corymbosa var. corymbosa]|uniref:OLC1v1017360C1 n=1 Tax=Oldenlandia corymbosa var. corymbosa TaxID=529605 RepID=A0AAV1E978_OLDCO|nr:OLC1v1017360C1 [Oldenlandia corymbosa var. corymbosa]
MEGSVSGLWKYLVGLLIYNYVSMEEKLSLIFVDLNEHAHWFYEMLLKFSTGEMSYALMDKLSMEAIYAKIQLFDLTDDDDDDLFADTDEIVDLINSMSDLEIVDLWGKLINMRWEPELREYDETSDEEYSSYDDEFPEYRLDLGFLSEDQYFTEESDSWFDSDCSDEFSEDEFGF